MTDNCNIDVRPYLVGIAGGGFTGKSILSKNLLEIIDEYPICRISLTRYYKDATQDKKEIDFNEPDSYDFDLLYIHLEKLRNGQPCEIPIYDEKAFKRTEKTEKVAPCSIILVEGNFCFYDPRIRYLLDIKIFMDIESDIILSRNIIHYLEEGKTKLYDIIESYKNKIKPSYQAYIYPTKKYADIIFPQISSHSQTVAMIKEYILCLLNKLKDNNLNEIFNFDNEMIDDGYKFFYQKILIDKEKIDLTFLKGVFQDFISNQQDEEFFPCIRQKLVSILPSLYVQYFRKVDTKNVNLPITNLLLYHDSDVTNINFKEAKNIFFFKTAILSDNDIKIPKDILSKNKDCQLVVFSLFLAPRCIHILGDQISNVIFVSLYFSNFYIKFEQIIKKDSDNNIYNEKEIRNLFNKVAHSIFSIEKIEEPTKK